MEMGFSRYAVLQALTASNNNIATAMNILLSEWNVEIVNIFNQAAMVAT